MRPAPFIRRIVATYRRAIDAYLADPCGYKINEADWKSLYDNRARDFTTTFAFGHPTQKDIGFTGEREPRFFSDAVKEAGFQDDILNKEAPINKANAPKRKLSVRVNTLASAKAAVTNGADVIYVGGEAFRPNRPWSYSDYADIINFANGKAKVIINTPRTTMRRECGELEQFFTAINNNSALQADGIMVSNLGSLKLAKKLTKLPVYADTSFNLFNHLAARFLKENGLVQGAASFELSFEQLKEIVEASELPIETVVHGSYESMICDHNLPAMSLPAFNELNNPEIMDRHYALLDTAGEKHSIRVDQFGRNHIYFAKDLCFYPYLAKFNSIASYRIEAQDYSPEFTGTVTKIYRTALDKLENGENACNEADLNLLKQGPRELGIGVYRFRQSRNSI